MRTKLAELKDPRALVLPSTPPERGPLRYATPPRPTPAPRALAGAARSSPPFAPVPRPRALICAPRLLRVPLEMPGRLKVEGAAYGPGPPRMRGIDELGAGIEGERGVLRGSSRRPRPGLQEPEPPPPRADRFPSSRTPCCRSPSRCHPSRCPPRPPRVLSPGPDPAYPPLLHTQRQPSAPPAPRRAAARRGPRGVP